ncbi:MAG: hypothetical protein NTX50_12715 [Candidatus Sumerlaeota bacterium]|nr:hypothetical protein [Candidatus Sumerlaeota bacterium]
MKSQRNDRTLFRGAVSITAAFCLLAGFAAAQTTASIRIPMPGDNKPIKVGVFASLYSASGPSWWQGQPIGFSHLDIAGHFKDPKYELYAIIDPDSDNDPKLKAALRKFGLSYRWIEGTDVPALSQLDAMISGHFHVNISWEMLDTITVAVHEGASLVNFHHFGLIRPAYATGHQATAATWASHMNDDIARNGDETKRYQERMEVLFGIENADFVWHLGGIKWRVDQPHPLLGKYKKGDIVSMGVNGLVGNNAPISVVQAISDVTEDWDGRTVKNAYLNPLTIHRLGRGTAVNCALSGQFGNKDTCRRYVDWLAAQRDFPDDKDGATSMPLARKAKIEDTIAMLKVKIAAKGRIPRRPPPPSEQERIVEDKVEAPGKPAVGAPPAGF